MLLEDIFDDPTSSSDQEMIDLLSDKINAIDQRHTHMSKQFFKLRQQAVDRGEFERSGTSAGEWTQIFGVDDTELGFIQSDSPVLKPILRLIDRISKQHARREEIDDKLADLINKSDETPKFKYVNDEDDY